MNLLPFVIAVLLILSYGGAASLQKRIASRQNQRAHIGLGNAEMHILRQCEQQHYTDLPGTNIKSQRKKKAKSGKIAEEKYPKFNPPNAQLNLFPLVDKGRDEEPALYETAAKLLRLFYPKHLEKGVEYKLLDSILVAAKKRDEIRLKLETLSVKDFQPLYYTLLKGTKKHFPPLIDYFKIEQVPSQVNIFEAHPNMLAVFFGQKAAKTLYKELQKCETPVIELDTIIQLVNNPHIGFIDENVWKLLDFKKSKNTTHLTLTAVDPETGISLRKNLLLKAESAAK